MADPKTSQYLGGGYLKDVSNVFFMGIVIEGADPKTFEYVGSNCASGFDEGISEAPSYAKDKNRVYKDGRVVDQIDPKTFNIISDVYIKDKSYIYTCGDPIPLKVEGADPLKCTKENLAGCKGTAQ